jgi:hypothetical protein
VEAQRAVPSSPQQAPAEKSVRKPATKAPSLLPDKSKTEEKSAEPSDTDPTGQPELDSADPGRLDLKRPSNEPEKKEAENGDASA